MHAQNSFNLKYGVSDLVLFKSTIEVLGFQSSNDICLKSKIQIIYIFRCSIQASKFHKIPQYQPQYFFAWGLNLDFIKSKEKVFPTL